MAGYFTVADLLAIWRSSVDSLYAQPFLDGGDGMGLEAYDQAFAQYERVSQAIDRTMQSLYILPSSMQTSEPASGDARAIVGLSLTRAAAFHVPIVFLGGAVGVEEVAVDHGIDGGVDVNTGRRYYLDDNVVFEPGTVGPNLITATAEAGGYSYNNPIAGSVRAFVQPGAGQSNVGATVVAIDGADMLYAANEFGTFMPQTVGQYVVISSPLNDGKVRRVITYVGPSTLPIVHGGAVGLAQDLVLQAGAAAGYVVGETVTDSVTGASGILLYYASATGSCVVQRTAGYFAVGSNLVGGSSGTVSATASIDIAGMLWALYLGVPPGAWLVGETLTEAVTGATGRFLGMQAAWALVAPLSGTFAGGNAVTGFTSGMVMTPTLVGIDPSLVSESQVSWRILKWGDDLGFACTNASPPTGGRLGMLDELGREREIPRGNGETDVKYRKRVAQLPDVVSPNAIRRACSRFFTPHGWVCEFREVGTVPFQGIFYDVPAGDAPAFSYAYDMDYTARPADRFKVWLDYTEFRAFFLIGVPRTGLGEFGFGYDVHPAGFYDLVSPLLDFYDGAPAGEGALNASLWNDIVAKKAGGVGFDFYAQ